MPNEQLIHGLRVELDVTPRWWGLQGHKTISSKRPESACLTAKTLLMATAEFATAEVRATRCSLVIVVRVSNDVTIGDLCEKAGRFVERLNELRPE